MIKELDANDLAALRPSLKNCLAGLAAYHNRVAHNYTGMYPLHDFDHTLETMLSQLRQNKTHIAGLFWDGALHHLGGFCQATVSGRHGSLDYMYVDESLRGLGYGAQLMDWAMQVFEQAHVRSVDIKVVVGNDAQAFYEKYGFKTRAVVMARVFD